MDDLMKAWMESSGCEERPEYGYNGYHESSFQEFKKGYEAANKKIKKDLIQILNEWESGNNVI